MAPTDPPYLRIADDVRRRIGSGELRPGDRVPSARRLTQDWGVAIATASKALAALRQQGLTAVLPGVGTVVAEPPPQASERPPAERRPAPRRSERELDRNRIVAAAVAIADAEGMAEVSMRRVAHTLGVATMSLYRHVPGKDDLLLLMIDAAFAGLPVLPAQPVGWRQALEVAGRAIWTMFRRHPWLASATSLTRPQLAPNGMRLTDWVLTAMAATGLPPADRLHAHVSLFSYARGVAVGLEQEIDAQRESGLTSDEWMQRQEAEMTALVATGELPGFAELIGVEFDLDLDRLFEFGLARMLDGLESYLAPRWDRRTWR